MKKLFKDIKQFIVYFTKLFWYRWRLKRKGYCFKHQKFMVMGLGHRFCDRCKAEDDLWQQEYELKKEKKRILLLHKYHAHISK
jgi:hypothetical protein